MRETLYLYVGCLQPSSLSGYRLARHVIPACTQAGVLTGQLYGHAYENTRVDMPTLRILLNPTRHCGEPPEYAYDEEGL
jgi:hypothetical protein